MSDNSKVVEEIKPVEVAPKTDQQKAQEFVADYESLCEKHQMRIVTTPAFKARDDGTFSVVLQTSVGRLPQQ